MERISERCWTATSRFCRMNTVVVAGSDGCLLVDPGVHTDELATLGAEIRERFGRCALAVSSHPHWDHLLWSTGLGEVPRFASGRGCEFLAEPGRLSACRAEAVAEVPDCDAALLGVVSSLRDEGRSGRIEWGGPRVEFVVHDGHAPGHLGLFVPGDGVLIAGDMCSDDEVPLLDLAGRDPLGDYWDGLNKLARLAGDRCEVLVPGHGGVACGGAEIRARFGRDRAYLDSLAAGGPVTDARLGEGAPGWLIAEHEAAMAWSVRSRSSG